MDWSTIAIAAGIASAIGAMLGWLIPRLVIEGYKKSLTKDVERFKNDLTKEVETLKNRLDNRTYTSKVKFDIEIEAYKILSEATYSMIKNVLILFNERDYFRHREEVENKRIITNTIESINVANNEVRRHAPFIAPDIYTLFDEIILKCKKQSDCFCLAINDNLHHSKIDECFEQAHNISNLFSDLIMRLRDHIAKMEIYRDE